MFSDLRVLTLGGCLCLIGWPGGWLSVGVGGGGGGIREREWDIYTGLWI